MSDTAKIVRLDVDRERLLKTRLSRLRPELQALLASGKHRLTDLLARFFNQLDDRFFQLADQAQSAAEQGVFFDAMRDMRAQRRPVEKRILLALDDAFARLDAENAASDASALPENLALVQPEELEEMVALEAIIGRAHRQYADQLAELAFACDALAPQKVYAKNNPLTPEILCQSLQWQCRQLKIPVRARLVVYQTFDAEVLSQLTGFYQGLLAELNSPAGSRERAQAAPQVRPQTPVPTPAPEPGDFDAELAVLLNDMSRGVNTRPVAAVNHTLPLASLVELLTRVQRETQVDSGITDVRNLVDALNAQQGHNMRLSRMDSELIHLVGLLFEFILQDQDLADPIKQQVLRLQIPIMKVALVDKGFFTQSGHVARRLLNDMSLAAVGWTGDANDALLLKIQSLVNRILREFDADLSLFTECLADFSKFTEREQRRLALMEKRQLDAASGQALQEQAQRQVMAEVGLRTEGFFLSAAMGSFIHSAWSQVLLDRALRLGTESADWSAGLQTLTDLVWSLQPLKSAEDRKALIDLIPRLHQALRHGLDAIAWHPFEMQTFFKLLEDSHLQALAQPLTAPSAPAAVGQTPNTPEAAASRNLGPSDWVWQQVASFTPGSWFDLVGADGHATRCRLAAVIKQTGTYIFVNRSGVKVAERSHQALAQALKSGELRPLDNSMLFDRALEEVVSGLRRSHKSPLDFSDSPGSSGPPNPETR